MMKRLFALIPVLLFCLTMLPTTALAAAPSGQELYVGGVQISSTGYWTTDSAGTVTSAGATQPSDNYIYYDADTNTLTLHNATIQKELIDSNLLISGSAIGVLNQNGNAGVTVQLEGTNTIENVSYGICVSSSGGGAALNIKGNGTLVLNSNYQTIQVISSNGNAALSIENAKVTATSSNSFGVTAQSGSSETSSASLTVDGGSLTATAQSSGVSGIRLRFGTGKTGKGTPTVTVSNNAIVRANGSAGEITSNSSTGIQYETGSGSTGGIVFDGKNGAVYGNVTLQAPITINKGETLTIPAGSALDSNGKLTNNGTILVSGGTLTGEPGGKVEYKVTGVTLDKNTLALFPGESDALTATVAPENATDKTVTWSSDNEKVATVNGGTVTAVAPGTATITATTTDGGFTATCAVTVNPVPVTGVTLNQNTLALFTGESATLTATVAPENATDKTVTWTSDNEKVAAVADGKVTAVASGTANITVTTTDGSFAATCAVTVTDKTYTISVGPGNLDFGTVYLGYAQPAAQTVTVTSTGNQKVTVALPTATNFIITAGEGFADGRAVIEPGKTAAFTVQPKQGLTVGRYAETLTVTCAEGAKVELPVTFTVNPVPVTGVTLDKKTLSLFTGDSATLTATVAPENATDKTVTWVSSNPAIVTVDGSGHVKAVAAGTANITVTTTDGNKTAVCAVTVTGRTYTLSSDPSAIAFGNVNTGYNPPAAQVVVVKNTGNQSLNLTQPKATNFGVGKLSQTALKPGETATFIVQPKAGLGEGSYKETLAISGDGGAKATVNLSFVVQASPAATATPAPTPLEMHTLHFDTNGGLPMDDVKFGLGAPVELWPYTPVRAGYLFQGWYSDQALTKAVGTIVLVKDTTIYAKWAPDPAAASSGSGSGSGSGSSSGNKGGTTITVTPAPTATATPTPTPTVTPTPEPTATPEATLPPEETDKGSFPVVPVAAGAIILLVLVGGIVIFRRFRD